MFAPIVLMAYIMKATVSEQNYVLGGETEQQRDEHYGKLIAKYGEDVMAVAGRILVEPRAKAIHALYEDVVKNFGGYFRQLKSGSTGSHATEDIATAFTKLITSVEELMSKIHEILNELDQPEVSGSEQTPTNTRAVS